MYVHIYICNGEECNDEDCNDEDFLMMKIKCYYAPGPQWESTDSRRLLLGTLVGTPRIATEKIYQDLHDGKSFEKT